MYVHQSYGTGGNFRSRKSFVPSESIETLSRENQEYQDFVTSGAQLRLLCALSPRMLFHSLCETLLWNLTWEVKKMVYLC